jgi:hypothetical protein
MAKSSQPKLDKPMRKDIARFYAQMMYADDLRKQELSVENYKKKLIQQALDNIKEHVFKECPYCHTRQEFPGAGHRELTINNKFYWVQNCPSCKQEVYCNLFLRKYTDNMGQPDYYVDSKWMTKNDAMNNVSPEKPVLLPGVLPKKPQ